LKGFEKRMGNGSEGKGPRESPSGRGYKEIGGLKRVVKGLMNLAAVQGLESTRDVGIRRAGDEDARRGQREENTKA